MVRFFIAAASLLSLLSFSRAATIDVRQCKYTCPSDPNYTTNVDSSLAPNDITICRYIDAHGNTVRECQYNIVSQVRPSPCQTKLTLPLRLPERSYLVTPRVLAPARLSYNVEALFLIAMSTLSTDSFHPLFVNRTFAGQSSWILHVHVLLRFIPRRFTRPRLTYTPT